jgi:hypothetical protein
VMIPVYSIHDPKRHCSYLSATSHHDMECDRNVYRFDYKGNEGRYCISFDATKYNRLGKRLKDDPIESFIDKHKYSFAIYCAKREGLM